MTVTKKQTISVEEPNVDLQVVRRHGADTIQIQMEDCDHSVSMSITLEDTIQFAKDLLEIAAED